MKKLHLTAAIVAVSMLAWGSAAYALPTPLTDPTFFTPTVNGTLTFTFEGHSAADLDHMTFTINGDPIFTNQSTLPGTQVVETVLAGVTYRLTLTDVTTPNTWSSNPADNGGDAHLGFTGTFSDFNLPGHPTAPFPVTSDCVIPGACYLGWEDRPIRNVETLDFNDLVFAEQFTPSETPPGVPEPASMTLLGSGLIALGLVMRRRRRKAA